MSGSSLYKGKKKGLRWGFGGNKEPETKPGLIVVLSVRTVETKVF